MYKTPSTLFTWAGWNNILPWRFLWAAKTRQHCFGAGDDFEDSGHG